MTDAERAVLDRLEAALEQARKHIWTYQVGTEAEYWAILSVCGEALDALALARRTGAAATPSPCPSCGQPDPHAVADRCGYCEPAPPCGECGHARGDHRGPQGACWFVDEGTCANACGGYAGGAATPREAEADALAKEVFLAWRDGMLCQGREVAPARMDWETLSAQDKALDAHIAWRVVSAVRLTTPRDHAGGG